MREEKKEPYYLPPAPSPALPGSAVAHSCEKLRVSIRSQPWLDFKLPLMGPGSLWSCIYQRELKPDGNILVRIPRNQLLSSPGVEPADDLCSMQP